MAFGRKWASLLQHSVPDPSVCLRAESVWDSYRRASLLACFMASCLFALLRGVAS